MTLPSQKERQSCYVELHCHSNFSFLDGACHPEDLVEQAARLGYRALAITDHNGFYGIVRFDQAARTHGVRAIFGSEITLESDHHLVLLVKDAVGYRNLSQMLSTALLSNKKGEPKVTRETLRVYSEGLIALSGCTLGEVPLALLHGDYNTASRAAREYRDLFGDENFYLELHHHNLPLHERLSQKLIALGGELEIPVVATNNVHYAILLAEAGDIPDNQEIPG